MPADPGGVVLRSGGGGVVLRSGGADRDTRRIAILDKLDETQGDPRVRTPPVLVENQPGLNEEERGG
jgi:hypothetical protein